MTREYAVPDCIGQMVKVEYTVRIVFYDSEHEPFEPFIRVFFEVDMFKNLCGSKWENSEKFFQVYINDLKIKFTADDTFNYVEITERMVDDMLDLTETRLKYVLGMERIA